MIFVRKQMHALLAWLVLTVGTAQAGEVQALAPDEWQAQMKAATEIQKEASELRERVRQLELEEGKKDLANIDELTKKAEKLHRECAWKMALLSGLTDDVKLSAMAALRAGQNFMRAEEFLDASAEFDRVANNAAADAELRAQANYWNALCHERLELKMEAKRLYLSITKEFPDSKWAKYARGRLSAPDMQ